MMRLSPVDGETGDKEALRERMRSWRERLTQRERRERDGRLRLRVLGSPALRDSTHLMSYAAFRNEADTWGLMRVAAAGGKTVYLPRTYREERRMEPVPLRWSGGRFTNLRRGAFGICEADGAPGDVNALDLVFVPGLVFDRCGYRIGFGGGFYDRFLGRLAGGTVTVGLCYREQLVDRVQRAPHDLPVDVIITDAGALRADAVRAART